MKLTLTNAPRLRVSTTLPVLTLWTRSPADVCRDFPVFVVSLRSTPVLVLPASTAPPAATLAPVRAPRSSATVPETTKSVRERNAFAAFPTAKSVRGAFPATVPELDSPGMYVTRMWMSVRRVAVGTADDVRTRLDRMTVTVHRRVSAGHDVTSPSTNAVLAVSLSAIIKVSSIHRTNDSLAKYFIHSFIQD